MNKLRIIIFIFLLNTITFSNSFATEQTPDTVLYKDSSINWSGGNGLDSIIKAKKIKFQVPDTACYDGHVANWEINENKLYLVGLRGWVFRKGKTGIENLIEVSMEYLFPGSEQVFANWFDGEMILLINEKEIDETAIFDCEYYIIKIKSGIVLESNLMHNKFDWKDKEQSLNYMKLFGKFPTFLN